MVPYDNYSYIVGTKNPILIIKALILCFQRRLEGVLWLVRFLKKMNWRILFVRLIALCKTLTMAVVVFRFYFQGSFKGIQGYWTGVCKAVCMG